MSPLGTAAVLIGFLAAAPIPPAAAHLQPPTPAEFAAAVKAYEALGGSGEKFGGAGDQVYHGFKLFKPTAEACGKLPDPPFEYRLTLFIGPDTPAGALAPLGRLDNLRWVEVELRRDDRGQEPAPADAAARVAELAAVPNLERLSLWGPDHLLTDELAGRLTEFKALRSLVGRGPITDAGLAALARHPKIDRLSFQGCPNATDAGLAHLATMPGLRWLVLQGYPKATAAGLKPFAAEPRLTMLSGGPGVNGDALEVVAGIHTLERLSLSGDRKGQTTGRQLAALGRLPRLRELSVDDTRFDDEAFAGLASAAALEKLYIRDASGVTDAGMKDLAKLANLKTVTLLGANRVTDAGLADLGRLSRLETLGLHGLAGATDAGTAELARLPKLGTLHLTDAGQVGDAGLKALAGAKSLTEVSVWKTAATEAGARAVVAGRGKALRRLGVRGLGVGDDFVAFVAATAPDLVSIDLHENPRVTVKSLEVLFGMPRLQTAALHGTGIPHETMIAFWKRLRERE